MIKRIKRVRLDPKAKRKSKPATSDPAPLFRLFGQPQLLEGEDRTNYDNLAACICAAITPVDTIEEMFVVDVIMLEWESLRWRRLKWRLVQTTALNALQDFLTKQLEANYALHQEHFERYLAKILRNKLPDEKTESAEILAADCAPHTAEANAKLDKLLSSIGLEMDPVLDDARTLKAKELVQQYVQREPDSVTLVDELLIDAGTSMDVFMADALAKKLDDIERIDRLSTIAEDRRNAHLAEIERRRAILGATLRQNVQKIEDAEFKLIETTPAKGRNRD